jgi:LAO/AO transport system kinase
MSAKNRERDAARDRARKNAAGTIRQASAWTPESLASALAQGQRDALAQAITWVESTLPEHQSRIESLLELTSAPRNSLRIGFTGIPGAGKSTLIERFGLEAIRRGWRVAVLAVDPSSQRTGGSLLGDKTRMTDLSKHPDAFVRPSAASTTLGGVARATAEAIQLCEAAGYDLILVETVGVGQSEVAVRSMVDMFGLLLIGGAGDDVQGIKRGIVEMADFLVVHKAEQERLAACRDTAQAYQHALHVFGQPPSGTPVQVMLASSLTGEGHEEIWAHIESLKATWKQSGWWEDQRRQQRLEALQRHARQLLVDAHMHRRSGSWNNLEAEVVSGQTSPFAAARRWVQREDSQA